MTSFAICNNVTPVLDDPDLINALEVRSPDRLARATVMPDYNRANLLEKE